MAPLKIVIEHLSWSLSAIQQIPTGYLLYILYMGFPGSSAGKVSSCNAGDPGLIPGLGRSLGEGSDNTLQYSCLGNPMDREGWWATVKLVQCLSYMDRGVL